MIDNENLNTKSRIQLFDLTNFAQNKNRNLNSEQIVTYQEVVSEEIDVCGLLDERFCSLCL